MVKLISSVWLTDFEYSVRGNPPKVYAFWNAHVPTYVMKIFLCWGYRTYTFSYVTVVSINIIPNQSSSLYLIPGAFHKGSVIMMIMIFSDHSHKKSNYGAWFFQTMATKNQILKKILKGNTVKKFHRLYIPLCLQIPQTFKNCKFKYFKQHKPMLLFAIC